MPHAVKDLDRQNNLCQLLEYLLEDRLRMKKIAIAVSSSGTSSRLLDNGFIAHSTFKLSLNDAHKCTLACNMIVRKRGLLFKYAKE